MERKKLVIAASVALGLSASAVASAGSNPLQSEQLKSGYSGMQLADKGADGKCGAGKCGAGNCGDKMKDKGKDKDKDTKDKKANGKCGAGNCGSAQ